MNRGAPATSLAELVHDLDDDVRWFLAQNVSTPEATLAELARDKDDFVREAAAENSHVVLEDLAEAQASAPGSLKLQWRRLRSKYLHF